MASVAIVGAGAAGMTAAIFAARRGLKVTLIERNVWPGRKLMITGKGRCNLTNACEIDEFMGNVPQNERFLFGALSRFSPYDTMAFFEELGVPLKVERGKRVFPVSDKAMDVVDALHLAVKALGCHIEHGRALQLKVKDGTVTGVVLEGGKLVSAEAVIICTGGLSYPRTGSTGDGFTFARCAGHTVTPLRPSLVPLETVEEWAAELQGLSLRNVTVTVMDKKNGKEIYSELGEMLFTHYGVTGPLVLSASAHLRQMEPGRYELNIDLKPGLDETQLDKRLLRDFEKYSTRDFVNSLNELLPSKLIPVFVMLSGVNPQFKSNQITKEQRRALVTLLKCLPLTIKGFRPIDEAVITAGGIKTSEINPVTMESKIVKNLFFAGEIIDVDAYTGGFNLQIAFSTGHAAGVAALSEN